ncbi:MAG: RHS repeat-associated core domain-containing protein, partial [Treponema sp.]|nr:RHS repeat-associated core domain-containing protein [Treponema sp.]
MKMIKKLRKLFANLLLVSFVGSNLAFAYISGSAYDDFASGRPPSQHYFPEQQSGGGGGSDSGGGGGSSGGGGGSSFGGGTQGSGGGAGGGTGGDSGSAGGESSGSEEENPGSGGSSDSGGGSEESDSERRYREALEAMRRAESVLNTFDNLYNAEKAKYYTAHKEEIQKARDLKAAAEAVLKAKAVVDSLPKSTVGDPVFITNGTFKIDDVDESFVYGISEYNLTRKLTSTEFPDGSFGKNWFTGLDSRIIWGKTKAGLSEKKNLASRLDRELNSLCSTIRAGDIDPDSCSAILSLKRLLSCLYGEIDVIERNASTAQEKNRYTEYGMSKLASEMPADCFVLIDEDGSLNVFQSYGSSGRYYLYTGYDKWANEKEDGMEICYVDGTVKKYDEFGQISEIKNRYNSSIQFEYNEIKNEKRTVNSISHNGKHILDFERDDSDCIVSVFNSRNNSKRTYSYDEDKCLVEMCIDNKRYGFEYDDSDDISRIIKPDGSAISISYYLEGNGGKKRASLVKDETGASENFVGDYSAGKMTYTDADGNQYHYNFSEGNITMEEMEDGTTVTRTYSSEDRVVSKNDEYGTVEYAYDGYGNMIKAQYSDGSSEQWSYRQPNNLLYQYKDRDGVITKFEYDESGSPVKIYRDDVCVQEYECNDVGQVVYAKGLYSDNRYSYDSETYRLTSDKYGDYAYDSSGKLVSYTTKDGRAWNYSYDSDGNTVTVISPENLKSVYVYNNREDLVSLVETDLNDGCSRAYRYEYDKRHLLTRLYSGYGKNENEARDNESLCVSYEYTPGSKIESVVYWNTGDAAKFDGNGIKYFYGYKNGLLSYIENYYVDEEGNPVGRIYRSDYTWKYVDGKKKLTCKDENGKTSYVLYDRDGNALEYGGENGWKLKYEYSAGGFLVQQKNVAGGTLKYEYDGVSGNVQSVQLGNSILEQYEYDGYGRVIHSTTQNGFVQDYSYEENDGSVNVCIDSNRGKTKMYSDMFGRIQFASINDEYGNAILEQGIEYKNDGKVEMKNGDERRTVKLNAWGEMSQDCETETEYHYDQDGNCVLIESIDAPVYISYNAFGMVSKIKQGNLFQNYYYNVKGNLLKIEDSLGINARYEYDATGKKLVHSEERGMPVKEYEYDDEGHLVKYIEGGETVMTYSYDDANGITTFTDAKGNSLVQKTDGYGRIIQETNRSGKICSVEYDDEDGVMKVKGFNGNVYTVTQSGALNAYVIQYQDGNTEKTFFNAAGSVVRSESNGISETFKYDRGQRLEEFRFRDKTGYNAYDSLGRRKSLELEDEKLEYEYDKKNRLIRINGLDCYKDIFYDEFGQEKMLRDSTGARTEYRYDGVGRLVAAAGYDSNGALIFMDALVYDDNGKVACSINEEGFIKVYEYDGRGRVKKVHMPYTQELEKSCVAQLEECGKTAGKYTSRKIQLSSQLKDACEKTLVEAGQSKLRLNYDNPVWTEEYEYDSNGNRTKVTNPVGTLEYEYDVDNRLVKVNGNNPVTYQYDANGNLILQKTATIEKKWTYAQNNRPIAFEATASDGSRTYEEYRYDAFGRRVISGMNATLYDGLDMNPLYEWQLNEQGYESNFSGEERTATVRFRNTGFNGDIAKNKCDFDRFYIYANGKLLGQKNKNYSYSSGVSDANYSFMSDMRNSSGAVTDGLGRRIGNVNYDMSGKMFFSDAKRNPQETGIAVSIGIDHGFVGKKYDVASGAYNFGFRDYNPNTATFTTEDPIRDGLNWYTYCAGDPVNFVDMWGLKVLDVSRTLKQESEGSKLKIGNSNETIYKVGCVLTSYVRIAREISGREISLKEANDYAVEHNLFTNKNELSPENGTKLVNGLVREDCGKKLVYSGKISINNAGAPEALQLLEERQENYYVTGRVFTCSYDKESYYEHTLSINGNSVFEDEESKNFGKLEVRLNDTSNGNRQKLDNDVRYNKLLYMY